MTGQEFQAVMTGHEFQAVLMTGTDDRVDKKTEIKNSEKKTLEIKVHQESTGPVFKRKMNENIGRCPESFKRKLRG
jgi:hypothetical protein